MTPTTADIVTPSPVTPDGTQTSAPTLTPDELYLNRDLSWLEFNRRVLAQAIDDRTPLLERVRFLDIFTSNLDEFFMKRVGVLRSQVVEGKRAAHPDAVVTSRLLATIRQTVLDLLNTHALTFASIAPKLAENNIRLLRWADLTDPERDEANAYFRSNLFPILTPLAVDPGHPFPFISNLSESVGVILHHPDHGDNLFARIKVPENLPRWVCLRGAPGTPDGCTNPLPTPGAPAPTSFRFVSLYDIIRHNLDALFPGMLVADVMLFRVTRNAEIGLEDEEDETEDLRALVEQELRQRRFARVLRLEHGPDPNKWMLQFLTEELELTDNDVYEVPGGLEYQHLRALADLPLAPLHFDPWTPVVPPALADEDADVFATIRAGDILVHHPYESFNASVERFITAAAADPKVLAIKLTLYRTGDDSPFLKTLIRAAESDKQVVCVVELKARFDEQRNIALARKLEEAGVHVVYGILGLKTHTKTCLVVRQDPDRIRCYAHIGTGNYNPSTAKLYTDLGLFTAKEDLTGELVELFHHLTGRSLKQDYKKLLVAPVNMRQRFLDLIDREIENKLAGKPAAIVAKMNSLEDRKVIAALYRASQAGVDVDLVVRGFCCLRPGVPGLSDNIRVRSVIGRFLEHSRIYHFRNAQADPADGAFYIGSGDWMYRNFFARVEVIAPLEDRAARARCWEILQLALADKRQAWTMNPDGSYTAPPSPDTPGTHQSLMQSTKHRAAARRT